MAEATALSSARPSALGRWCRQAAVLLAVLALTATVVAWVAGSMAGRLGVEGALISGAICAAGGLLSLAASSCLRGPDAALFSLAFGMLFRSALPLAVLLAAHLLQWRWMQGGMAYSLLVFYLVMLATDVAMSLPEIAGGEQPKSVESSAPAAQGDSSSAGPSVGSRPADAGGRK